MSSKIALKPQSIRCHGNIVTSKSLDDFQSFNCDLEKEEETGIYTIKNDNLGFNRLQLSTDKQLVDVLRNDEAHLTVQLIDNQGNPVRLADVYVTLYITYTTSGEVNVYSSDYTDENGCITFIYSAQNNYSVSFQARSNTRISNTVFVDDRLYHSLDEEIFEFNDGQFIDILHGTAFPNLDGWGVKMDVCVSNDCAIIVEPSISSKTRLSILKHWVENLGHKVPQCSWAVDPNNFKPIFKEFNNVIFWDNDLYYTITIQKHHDNIIYMFMNERVEVSVPEVSNWGDLRIRGYCYETASNTTMKVKNFTVW